MQEERKRKNKQVSSKVSFFMTSIYRKNINNGLWYWEKLKNPHTAGLLKIVEKSF